MNLVIENDYLVLLKNSNFIFLVDDLDKHFFDYIDQLGFTTLKKEFLKRFEGYLSKIGYYKKLAPLTVYTVDLTLKTLVNGHTLKKLNNICLKLFDYRAPVVAYGYRIDIDINENNRMACVYSFSEKEKAEQLFEKIVKNCMLAGSKNKVNQRLEALRRELNLIQTIRGFVAIDEGATLEVKEGENFTLHFEFSNARMYRGEVDISSFIVNLPYYFDEKGKLNLSNKVVE